MRYFLIFYTGPLKGVLPVMQQTYPSLKLLPDFILKHHKEDLYGKMGYEEFIITNIIELSEQDYNDGVKQD